MRRYAATCPYREAGHGGIRQERRQWLIPSIQNDSGLPKDLQVLPEHPEPAVSWHSGFRRGAHA
jgi:hypothetical protein